LAPHLLELLLAAEALPVAAPLEPHLPCVAARGALLVAAPLEPHLLELLLEARAINMAITWQSHGNNMAINMAMTWQ